MPKDVLELRREVFELRDALSWAKRTAEGYRKELLGPQGRGEPDVIEWLRGRGYIVHREPMF